MHFLPCLHSGSNCGLQTHLLLCVRPDFHRLIQEMHTVAKSKLGSPELYSTSYHQILFFQGGGHGVCARKSHSNVVLTEPFDLELVYNMV